MKGVSSLRLSALNIAMLSSLIKKGWLSVTIEGVTRRLANYITAEENDSEDNNEPWTTPRTMQPTTGSSSSRRGTTSRRSSRSCVSGSDSDDSQSGQCTPRCRTIVETNSTPPRVTHTHTYITHTQTHTYPHTYPHTAHTYMVTHTVRESVDCVTALAAASRQEITSVDHIYSMSSSDVDVLVNLMLRRLHVPLGRSVALKTSLHKLVNEGPDPVAPCNEQDEIFPYEYDDDPFEDAWMSGSKTTEVPTSVTMSSSVTTTSDPRVPAAVTSCSSSDPRAPVTNCYSDSVTSSVPSSSFVPNSSSVPSSNSVSSSGSVPRSGSSSWW